jgi:hypothetical protein
MLVIGVRFGEIRRDFDGNVDSVEKNLPLLIIEDMAMVDSKTEGTTEDDANEKKDFLERNDILDHYFLIKYFKMGKIKKPLILVNKKF